VAFARLASTPSLELQSASAVPSENIQRQANLLHATTVTRENMLKKVQLNAKHVLLVNIA